MGGKCQEQKSQKPLVLLEFLALTGRYKNGFLVELRGIEPLTS